MPWAHRMKKCPYCAEEIQDEAVKCRYCMEFLTEARPAIPPPRPTLDSSPAVPWYFRTSFIVLMFLSFPPFVIPSVWLHPRLHVVWKAVITIAVIGFCWIAWVAIRAFIQHFMDLADSIQQLGM